MRPYWSQCRALNSWDSWLNWVKHQMQYVTNAISNSVQNGNPCPFVQEGGEFKRQRGLVGLEYRTVQRVVSQNVCHRMQLSALFNKNSANMFTSLSLYLIQTRWFLCQVTIVQFSTGSWLLGTMYKQNNCNLPTESSPHVYPQLCDNKAVNMLTECVYNGSWKAQRPNNLCAGLWVKQSGFQPWLRQNSFLSASQRLYLSRPKSRCRKYRASSSNYLSV